MENAFEAGGVDWLRCGDCRSLFDPSPPEDAALRPLYSGREYFVKSGGSGDGRALLGYPTDYLADREGAEAKFDRVLGHLDRYVEPGRLLDVGCGPGFLVAAAERRGWQATGVDLNDWAVTHGREELGLDLRQGELADLDLDDAELDAVTMTDLIEHLPDPDAVMADVARVVKPGGAIAVLTPDAGSPVSRALGRRWPELRRPGEHTILFTPAGLAALLARHGFVAAGRHSIGKVASVATLVADMAPAAPGVASRLRGLVAGTPAGERVVDFDPRTKFCLYARRLPSRSTPPRHRPVRLPRRPERLAAVERAISEELVALAGARRYCDWMFDQFAEYVRGSVAEVGAGIGTFSKRILERKPDRLLLLEPEPACATTLERELGDDPRVTLVRESLPGAPSLSAGEFDLVVCQNVLEHVAEDAQAVDAMAAVLSAGGRLALLVPAGEKLFGPLDEAYGHWRRYEAAGLRELVAGAGLEIERLDYVNALGIPGWWAKNALPGARIGSGSLRLYEAMLAIWRPLEGRLSPRSGLSLVCIARRL